MPFFSKVEHKKWIKKLKTHIFKTNVLHAGARFDNVEVEGEDEGFQLPYSHPVILYFLEQLNYYKLYRFTHKLPLFIIKMFGILFHSLEATFYGQISRDIDRNIDHIMGDRIRKKYGEKEALKVIRRLRIANMRYLARAFLEDMLVYPAMLDVKDFYKKYVTFKTLDPKLYKKIQRTGCIALVCHQGHFLTYTWWGMSGHVCGVIIDIKTLGGFIPFILKGKNFVVPMPSGDRTPKDKMLRNIIEKHLKNKALLCIFGDAGYPHFPCVPLFDKHCRTAAGPVALALLYNIPLVPMWLLPDPDRKHHTMVLGREIKLDRDISRYTIVKDNQNKLDQKRIVLTNAQIMNKFLEKSIRQHITTWTFLPIFHQNKLFHKTTLFSGQDSVKSLIERLEFNDNFIKMSYEEDRDNKSYHALLREAIKELKEL